MAVSKTCRTAKSFANMTGLNSVQQVLELAMLGHNVLLLGKAGTGKTHVLKTASGHKTRESRQFFWYVFSLVQGCFNFVFLFWRWHM